MKSLICVFAAALEFKYAIINLCVASSPPPPDANPVVRVKRAGTAALVGGVGTDWAGWGEECTNSSWCKIPCVPEGLEALVLSRARLVSAERRWESSKSCSIPGSGKAL